MDEVTDVELMAYVDGELTRDDVNRIETALASNPDLRARLQVFAATRAPVARAFDHIMAAPVPDALVALVRGGTEAGAAKANAAQTIPFPRRDATRGRTSGPWLQRLAASIALLAIGGGTGYVLATTGIATHGPAGNTRTAVAPTTISQALQTALEQQPSGAAGRDAAGQPAGVRIRIKGTFQARDARFCREYTLATGADAQFAGVACRTAGDGWLIEHQARSSASGKAAKAMGTASGKDDTSLDAVLNDLEGGHGRLDPHEEQELIGKLWRGELRQR